MFRTTLRQYLHVSSQSPLVTDEYKPLSHHDATCISKTKALVWNLFSGKNWNTSSISYFYGNKKPMGKRMHMPGTYKCGGKENSALKKLEGENLQSYLKIMGLSQKLPSFVLSDEENRKG